jgi:hypothetical protein
MENRISYRVWHKMDALQLQMHTDERAYNVVAANYSHARSGALAHATCGSGTCNCVSWLAEQLEIVSQDKSQ